MGKIFNKDKDKVKKPEVVMASAPESPETPGEKEYMENPSGEKEVKEVNEQPVAPQVPQIQEVPRCMSQTEINNIIISMDMKINYIISKMEE